MQTKKIFRLVVGSKLASISKKEDWHLTNVSRTENNAGLVTLTAKAVTRLNNNQLSTLETQLKTLNKPGGQYKIDDIDPTPELDTINQTKALLA